LQLRVAFSRDQPVKVYVQHLLKEDAAHVWRLLQVSQASSWDVCSVAANARALLSVCWPRCQAGGHVYVCGDATRMASDVHAALCDIVAVHGNLSSEAAAALWEQLASADRYQRDVWAV